MKLPKRLNKGIASAGLLAALTIGFQACSSNSPVSPAQNSTADSELHFLELGSGTSTLNKGVNITTTKTIAPEKGGKLKIDWQQGDAGSLKAQMNMKVKKKSLNAKAELMLTLDDLENFSGIFCPTSAANNLSLSRKSLLSIRIQHADLSGLDESKIGVYFKAEGTDGWKRLSQKSLTVDQENGLIEVVKAKVPGFGRFALYPPSAPKVIMETTGHVSYKDGGELVIDYKGYEHGAGPEEVKTTFKVFSETISEDADLVLSMTDALLSGDVDVTFQPHGLVFSSPALLNIEAKHIDLSGVDPSTIGIFYVNEETGQWEKMVTYDIIVKLDEGYLKIIDAEIPHFSRYAVAWSK